MKKSISQTPVSPKTLSASSSELLFASVFLSVDNIKKTLSIWDAHPEKKSIVSVKLFQQLAIYKEITGNSEIIDKVKKRITEWRTHFGEPSMSQFAFLGKTFGIPMGDLLQGKTQPKDICDFLKCYVVGQDDYVRKLSTSFSIHLLKNSVRAKNLDLPKNSLLVCGPSGSGKTFAVQTLAKCFNMPMVTIHANTIVPVGIVGTTIPDYFTSMLSQGYKPKELEASLVFIDELDKTIQSPLYYEALQNEILSLCDDKGEIECKLGPNDKEMVKIPTKNMMFVYTGVFDGIEKILEGGGLGFSQCHENAKHHKLELQDIVAFGLKPELVGRIQNITMIGRLTANDMLNILNSPLESPFLDYQNYFRLLGAEFTISEDAKMYLSEMAVERKLGARGLKSMLNDLLADEMFDFSGRNIEINADFLRQHNQL